MGLQMIKFEQWWYHLEACLQTFQMSTHVLGLQGSDTSPIRSVRVRRSSGIIPWTDLRCDVVIGFSSIQKGHQVVHLWHLTHIAARLVSEIYKMSPNLTSNDQIWTLMVPSWSLFILYFITCDGELLSLAVKRLSCMLPMPRSSTHGSQKVILYAANANAIHTWQSKGYPVCCQCQCHCLPCITSLLIVNCNV